MLRKHRWLPVAATVAAVAGAVPLLRLAYVHLAAASNKDFALFLMIFVGMFVMIVASRLLSPRAPTSFANKVSVFDMPAFQVFEEKTNIAYRHLPWNNWHDDC